MDTSSTPGLDDIEGDEQSYFSRSRLDREKARREEAERDEHGLTPREYQERGYAFANSFAAGGSKGTPGGSPIGSPVKERSQIRSMLGGMGRNRSGSGGSKKSSAGAMGAAEDPFAGGEDVSIRSPVASGPAVPGYTNFETQFTSEFDFDDSRRSPLSPPNGSAGMSRNASSTGMRNPSPIDTRVGAGDSSPFDSQDRTASTSPGGSRSRSRAGSAASTGGGSWFNRGSKAKSSKTKGSTVSSGLRERAEQMKWGAERDGPAAAGRESFDSLDDEAQDDDGFGSRGRYRSSTVGAGSGAGTVSAFDRAALSNQGRGRSASSPLKPRQSEEAKNPFDSSTSLSSTDGGAVPSRSERNAYSAKPWDSEEELYASPPQVSPSTRGGGGGSGASSPARANAGRARSGTNASATSAANALDLRQVEADFAGVMQLSKHGGSGEVGARTMTGGGTRSRSGTVGGGGGGIGSAIALYDFPGVEVSFLLAKLRLRGKEDRD